MITCDFVMVPPISCITRLMTMASYKYTCDGKVKREYISSSIMVDGLYERASKYHTKPYGDDTYWETRNHVYEEIDYYRNVFDSIVMKKSLIDKVEDGCIEHTGYDNCYCIDCIIRDKINSITVGGTIHTLSGKTYTQIYRDDKPLIVRRSDKYYNVVGTRDSMLNKEVPLSDFIDTIY